MREVLLFLSGLIFVFWLAASIFYLFTSPVDDPLNLILGVLVSGSILAAIGSKK